MLKSLLLAVTIVAHEPGYMTSLAKHLQRWLGSENVAAQIVTPQQMENSLKREKIAFLVGFSNPSAAEMATLRTFRARGGKLVVFYSASPALAELMGVRQAGYASAPYPGAWSRMDFEGLVPSGLPRTILQTSTLLQRARPIPGRSRVLAMWTDRKGRSSGEPAWLASDAGYWMTHVLQADGDENLKAQLLGAIVGAADPRLWSAAAHEARVTAQRKSHRALALCQVPRKGEIHAVWDHTGRGLYPGNWAKTMFVLKEARVTDLFVNVAGAGFAHYQSRILSRSKACEVEGDQLAQCLAAAKGTGIRVHAWILCFSATRGGSATLDDYARKGWRLRGANGKLTEYLNPSIPAVRNRMIEVIDEITTRYPVSGIHLDFVRWGDGLKATGGEHAVTRFVAEARRHVKRPKWLTTAVYGKYPQCVTTVGQDWQSWLNQGLVDYVVPMNYTDSTATFAELLRNQSQFKHHAARTIVGIGVTANESRLDAAGVIRQANLARLAGMAGISLFDLDRHLETQILPYLKLGLW